MGTRRLLRRGDVGAPEIEFVIAARGKRSGVEVRAEGADLFHLRGGKVTRLVIYFDLQNALADLGLEE